MGRSLTDNMKKAFGDRLRELHNLELAKTEAIRAYDQKRAEIGSGYGSYELPRTVVLAGGGPAGPTIIAEIANEERNTVLVKFTVPGEVL